MNFVLDILEGGYLDGYRHTDCRIDYFLYLMTGIYDKFSEAFTKAVQKLRVGHGLDPGVTQVRTNANCYRGLWTFRVDYALLSVGNASRDDAVVIGLNLCRDR